MATSLTSEDLSAPVGLDWTVGISFVGLVLSTLLFGISNLQLYIYYAQYPKDWIVYKVSAVVLWLLDGLNLVFTIHGVYHYVVRNFGKYDQLDVIVWSFKARIVVNVVIVVIVQGLYTTRLWRLTVNYQRRWYPKFVPLVIVLETAIGIALIVETFRLRRFSQLGRMEWATYSSFAASVAVDTCIAGVTMCYLRGSRTDFDRTNNILSTLVVWVVGTGAATSLCALLALIAYACLPGKFVFLAVELLLSKLYVNSFLAFLNARKRIRQNSSTVVVIDGLRSQSQPRITLTDISKSDASSHPADHVGGKPDLTVVAADVHVEP